MSYEAELPKRTGKENSKTTDGPKSSESVITLPAVHHVAAMYWNIWRNIFTSRYFFYNPNITDAAEYHKRVEEEERLIRELPVKYPGVFHGRKL